MSATTRTFGALLSHDGVCLVEYRAERTGMRVVEQWSDNNRSASIDEALGRLIALVSRVAPRGVRMSLAIEQFGAFHHVMTLPSADDAVLRPVIRREVQRVFGLPDPVIVFTHGGPTERRDPSRADARTAPSQLLIAGAPKETIDAVRRRLAAEHVDVEIVTVLPKAMHSLYEATGASLEPTAVLVCLEGGPHLAFFLDGRLEMAIDPPIALEGERAPISVILDQVERGAVYFRQQFRGATATRMLLSARPTEYEELAAALEARLAVRVKPLFAGASSPEAAVAMGAVLEGRHPKPLDLFPHPPTFSERVSTALRGPNGVVAGTAAAALIAGIWAGAQFASLASARTENANLRKALQTSVPGVEPMRQIAEGRADYARQVEFVTNTRGERAALTNTLQAIAEQAPTGVSFDSLRVSRTVSGWAGTIRGEATGVTAAQAVRSLDSFYQAIRGCTGVSAATLDEFDYPAASRPDSTRKTAAPVVIQFHVSFAIDRNHGGSR